MAQQERRGLPVDRVLLGRARQHWRGMQVDLVIELDRPFGCYEIVDGVPHWRKERFANLVRRNGMSWPQTESGALDERDQTFREMAARYPQIEPLREFATHSRSCGLMTFRWVMMAATELHCGPTEPRPGAVRRVIQSTSWPRQVDALPDYAAARPRARAQRL